MAITALEFMVLCSFREHGILPPNPAVVELGESNWYGDVSIDQLGDEIRRLNSDSEPYLDRLRKVVDSDSADRLYEIARIFFSAVVGENYTSIDPGTQTSKLKFDLNLPVRIDEKFDLLLNIGTAEHIFNVHQLFKTAHALTKLGGLMMHSSPCTGWIDHGFFNFQPTFYFDLARANQYEILSFVFGKLNPFEYVQVKGHDDISRLVQNGKIPNGAHINVLFRKTIDADFAVPMQGYYAGTLSKESQKLWHELR